MKNTLWKCLAAGSAILSLAIFVRATSAADYTVHEWGTFTSVQGSDGELLSWNPLRTSELPGFVYNWSKPGLNRYATSMSVSKVVLVTLQRMETPVIYFYSGENMNVDVSVAFPKGLITEWYPQASQIGPSLPVNAKEASGALKESRAVWKNLQIVSSPKYRDFLQDRLPQDKSGSHYFAARTTSASMVRDDFRDQTNNVSEVEKFIFYRGAGSFKTPLRVTVNTNNSAVVVENTGAENLSHLFLVRIHDGKGAFALMDGLAASNSIPWLTLDYLSSENWKHFPLAQFQIEIGEQMEAALTSEGLFAEEAKAMVNTWKDSWFTEDGLRVLYILPRTWTDETLPMALNPQPEKLVRVMVGRAEIITPQAVSDLSEALTKSAAGDADARELAVAQLKALGRFAEPALRLANKHASQTNVMNLGNQLLYGSIQSKFE